jgi:ssDNA-binding Zn-finger/Zn-ribbon topoisomerase 1
MKIEDPLTLLTMKATAHREKVLSVLYSSGFDQTCKYCPEQTVSFSKRRSLKRALYSSMQKNVLAKANLTREQRPRIVLHLHWGISQWSGELQVFSKFFDGMDVETDRSGWEHRLSRSLKMMSEVAECKQETNEKCPKCGGLMIEKQMLHTKTITEEEPTGTVIGKLQRFRITTREARHPHYGEWFWGCLRYPECRGMKAYWIPEDQDNDVGNLIKDVTCPKCGSPMVVRLARRGANTGKKFLGCVQFPLCKAAMTKEEALAIALMRGKGL